MPQTLSHSDLKSKQRSLRDGFPQTMSLRVHRAISWIKRAEMAQDDPDAEFIFLWIAFNAAYADEDEFQGVPTGERSSFNSYFEKTVALDVEKRIYKAVWDGFSGPISLLLDNKYVYGPFWQHQNGISGCEDWEDRFAASKKKFNQALQEQDSARILSFVFDRLYVLRNQLVHGGATWGSGVNRSQVKDGAAILRFLMPIFVDVMMDNPEADWGKPFYPVIP